MVLLSQLQVLIHNIELDRLKFQPPHPLINPVGRQVNAFFRLLKQCNINLRILLSALKSHVRKTRLGGSVEKWELSGTLVLATRVRFPYGMLTRGTP